MLTDLNLISALARSLSLTLSGWLDKAAWVAVQLRLREGMVENVETLWYAFFTSALVAFRVIPRTSVIDGVSTDGLYTAGIFFF